MTPEGYESAWRNLPQPPVASQLEASEVSAAGGIWVAKDSAGRRHLLVQVPDTAVLDLAETHGLSASIRRHRIPGKADATFVDLLCIDQGAAPTFAAVASDIAQEAIKADPADRVPSVVAALSKWRWFWGADPTRMSATDAVGLFGELWFLIRWSEPSAASVEAWEGSGGARHDFQWPEYSVEVKTTSRSGAIMHTIQHLEQLEEPESGDLYLYSLRLARDALAANTLTTLVDAASASLADQPHVRADLLAKLGMRGYTPAARDQASVPYRVMEEALYRVSQGFPRLTRSSFADGLPRGVTRVSYQLDMMACQDWMVGTSPACWPPTFG